MSILDITFQNSIWIYLAIPLLGLLFFFYFIGSRKKKQSLASFLNPSLVESFTKQVSQNKRAVKVVFIFLATIFIILSIARPQLDYYWEERPEETTDILFALDTSKSMLAPDLKPNRLFRAKLAIEDLVKNLKGVRIGLIPFAGDAFLWCPLTYDQEAFIDSLRGVDTDIIPVGGTNLLSAVDTAEKAFTNDSKSSKLMILITDGEDLSEQLKDKLPAIAAQGWTIHTVGIGTEEGELIPLMKEDGTISYVKDADGNVVKTKLDATTLEQIAEKTGGTYHSLGATGEGLQELFDKSISVDLKKREETRLRKIPIDRYIWFVGIAIVLLATELLIKDRKNWKHLKETSSSLAILLMLFATGLAPHQVDASKAREAQKAFDLGDYKSSQTLYTQAANENPEKKRFNYNAGVSALNDGELESAKQNFDISLTSDDLLLQENSYYNRANTQYYIGRRQLDSDPQGTVKIWEEALKDYDGALALNPENTEAEKNKKEVHRLLEKLKELLKQDDQNQDQDNQDQDDQNENENQDQDKGDQDQDESQDQNQDNGDQDQGEQDNQQGDSQDNEDQSDSENSEQNEEDSESEEQNQPDQGEEEDKESDKKEEESSTEQEESKGEEGQNQPQVPVSEEEKEEALQLLESLKDEDGDFKELFFKLQNPDPENQTDKDW